MKIFSKEKFIEIEGMGTYYLCKGWVDRNNGKDQEVVWINSVSLSIQTPNVNFMKEIDKYFVESE